VQPRLHPLFLPVPLISHSPSLPGSDTIKPPQPSFPSLIITLGHPTPAGAPVPSHLANHAFPIPLTGELALSVQTTVACKSCPSNCTPSSETLDLSEHKATGCSPPSLPVPRQPQSLLTLDVNCYQHAYTVSGTHSPSRPLRCLVHGSDTGHTYWSLALTECRYACWSHADHRTPSQCDCRFAAAAAPTHYTETNP
jgi:hypothetical protein